jgi:hypothetical protein
MSRLPEHRTLIATTTLIATGVCTSSLLAGSLGEWRHAWGGGSSGNFTELGFEFETAPNDYDPPTTSLSTVWWGLDDIGSSVTFSAGDPGFDLFAETLANGHNDMLTLWRNAPGGGGGGYGTSEATAFAGEGDPDFAGHEIGAIRITLHDLTFNTIDGTFTNYTYDVYTYDVSFRVLPVCPADIDGDGAVSASDLVDVLLAWGDCPNGNCPADVDGDGVVGVDDLTEIILAWGVCQD